MKVIVTGGRYYKNRERVFSYLSALEADTVIAGDATGADLLALEWAMVNRKNWIKYEADWAKFDRAAGPIRNAKMIEEHRDANLVLAFPGGRGTMNCVATAVKAGIVIFEVGE